MHTNHLNLLYKNNPGQQTVWCLLFLAQCQRNDANDTLLQLPMLYNDKDKLDWVPLTKLLQYADSIPQEVNKLLNDEIIILLALEKQLKDKIKFSLTPNMIQW